MNPTAQPHSAPEIDVLIVEDNAMEAALLQETLGSAGYRVRLASDGAQALEAVQARQPNIILTDIRMPVMDGYALCREIKDEPRWRDIPVVLITGLTDAEDIVKGLVAGADHYITKPYDAGELLHRIEYLLKNKPLRKEGDAAVAAIPLHVNGKQYMIRPNQAQILDLLMSTVESAVVQHRELRDAQKRVKALTEQLRQQAEELQAVNESHRMLLERSADGIVVVDQKGIIRFVNPAAETLFDRNAEELLGKAFGFPIVADTTTAITMTRNGKMVAIEMQNVDTEWDRARAFVVFMRDITERKRMEQLKEEFISTISQELRTPMVSIKDGLASLAESAASPDQQDLCRKMTNQVDHLLELISSLLDMSKVEAGKIVLTRRSVDLAELVDQTCRSYQAIIGRRTIARQLADVPPVYADRNRILQVLGHLFSSAIKRTTEDDTITFMLEKQGDFVAVTIVDTGRQSERSEEDTPAAEESPTRRSLGLGLGMCKDVVELHGGEFSMRREPSQDCTFSFTLPVYYPVEAFMQFFDETVTAAERGEGQFGMLLIDVGEVRERLGDPANPPIQQVLASLEESVRRVLPRNDRVLVLDRTQVVIFAITDWHGMEAMRQRLQAACLRWVDGLLGPQRPARLRFAAAMYPHDGRLPTALIKQARSRLDEPAGTGLRRPTS